MASMSSVVGPAGQPATVKGSIFGRSSRDMDPFSIADWANTLKISRIKEGHLVNALRDIYFHVWKYKCYRVHINLIWVYHDAEPIS